MHRVTIIDSHTGGEPTRLVVTGGPDLGSGPLMARRARFRSNYDGFRRAVVSEPRGSDVMIGAMLCPPHEPDCALGVIFFNNTGYLGMCGHGTIGLIASMAHRGELQPGLHRIDTPVGVVRAELHENRTVTVFNVPAYRHLKDVSIEVPGIGLVTGDVAWGGNWFFLITNYSEPVTYGRVDALTRDAAAVRDALIAAGVTGANGAEIDHIEIFAPSDHAGCDSRNFVLCPGLAYDRSPCGTGTSAKVACLAADGKLAEGQIWRQEGIVGSVFEATYKMVDGKVTPSIRGMAYISAEATLVLDPTDPFLWGFNP